MTPTITPLKSSARTPRTPPADPLAELLRLREASVDAVVIPNKDLVGIVDAIRTERWQHEIAMSALTQQNADLYDRLTAAPRPARRSLGGAAARYTRDDEGTLRRSTPPSARIAIHSLAQLAAMPYSQHDLDEVNARIAKVRASREAVAVDADQPQRSVIIDGWDLGRR